MCRVCPTIYKHKEAHAQVPSCVQPLLKTLQAKKLDEIHAEAHAELGMVPATLLPTLETLQPLPRSQRDEVELFPALRGGELSSSLPIGGHGGSAAEDSRHILALNGGPCTHQSLPAGTLTGIWARGAAPVHARCPSLPLSALNKACSSYRASKRTNTEEVGPVACCFNLCLPGPWLQEAALGSVVRCSSQCVQCSSGRLM